MKRKLVPVYTYLININELKTFLDNTLKDKEYDLDAYYQDLVMQVGNTGLDEYEVSKFATKSGNPEIYYFTKYDEFGKEIK